LANTKSAKKKIKVIRRRTIENKIQKFKMKKAIKEVKKALLAGDIEKAKEEVKLMCEKLLCNPVMEEYKFNISEE